MSRTHLKVLFQILIFIWLIDCNESKHSKHKVSKGKRTASKDSKISPPQIYGYPAVTSQFASPYYPYSMFPPMSPQPSSYSSTMQSYPYSSYSFPSSRYPYSYGGSTAPTTYGGNIANLPFGGNIAPSPYGGNTGPSPYGSNVLPSPYGSHIAPSPYGSHIAPSPYGSHIAPSPYGDSITNLQFGGNTASLPFGGSSVPSPFGNTPVTSPYGYNAKVSSHGRKASGSHNVESKMQLPSNVDQLVNSANLPKMTNGGPISRPIVSYTFSGGQNPYPEYVPAQTLPSPYSLSNKTSTLANTTDLLAFPKPQIALDAALDVGNCKTTDDCPRGMTCDEISKFCRRLSRNYYG